MSIDNTASPDNRQLNAYGVLAVGSTDWITSQEAAGQRQLVASTSLPTDASGDDAEFLALGFTFGDPDPGDPMFRPVTLPDGWSKQPSDHDMWSHVVDELGRRRVAVFYKAAFYDRRAFMRLESLRSYAHDLRYTGGLPVYDDVWCTPETFAAAAAEMRGELAEDAERIAARAAEQPDDDYWSRHLAELRDELAAHDAWMARVSEAVAR
jgi:hypothetical protein